MSIIVYVFCLSTVGACRVVVPGDRFMTNRFDRQQLGETDLLARILNVLVAEFGGATAHPWSRT